MAQRQVEPNPNYMRGLNAFNGVYATGYTITCVIVFFSMWGYATIMFGPLLGLGLGWIPAAFVAIVVSFFWPLALAVIIYLLLAL